MANIGESHSAKLARERLEAIKKYLPLHNSVKQQLQSRQESQVEFEEDTKQLFKPITETTKPLLPALERTAEATGKIAERTKQTKRILRGLPAEIAAAQPIQPIQQIQQIPEGAEAPAPKQKKIRISSTAELINKFNEETVKVIMNEIKNSEQLAEFAVDSFGQRNKLMKPEHAKDITNRDQWQRLLFRILMNVEKIKSDDPVYQDYVNKIDNLSQSRKEEKKQKQERKRREREEKKKAREKEAERPKRKYEVKNQPILPEEIIKGLSKLPPLSEEEKKRREAEEKEKQIREAEEKEKQIREAEEKERRVLEELEEYWPSDTSSGSGLTTQGSGLITPCPNSVLSDVERLEILIGGKRAGNNSPEIINEVADICKRLFTGGIMDVDVYRSLINEIADDYHSD